MVKRLFIWDTHSTQEKVKFLASLINSLSNLVVLLMRENLFSEGEKKEVDIWESKEQEIGYN